MPAANRQDGWLNLSGEQRRAFTDKLLEVYGAECWRCRLPITAREDATCGHIISRKKGGPTSLENCRPEHSWCNYGAREDGESAENIITHDGLGFFWQN